MNNKAYDRITERIIALLEQGTVPWHKPWKSRTQLPRNLITKKPYRGINVFLLLALNYESPFWLTFRQAVKLGGSVKKGEKSCPVVFWNPKTVKDKQTGEDRKVRILRFYHVFNVAQCEGIGELPTIESTAALTKPQEIVEQMPDRPLIRHGMAKAYYSPSIDCIGMPDRSKFDGEEAYYATLFHELVHSTAHEKRLKRPLVSEQDGFASEMYSKEELIAEMGSAFLCAEADISERTVDNSASYIQGWLQQLRDDRTLVVQAAAQAQRAVDFILGIGQAAEEEVK